MQYALGALVGIFSAGQQFVDGRQVHKGIPAAHVRRIVSNRRFRGWLVHQDDENAICTDDRRYVPLSPAAAEDAPADDRKHVRIANGGTPEVIPTRDALAEMNTAQMEGKRDVREMSSARSSACIVYRDERGTVELRPATDEEIAAEADRIRTQAAKVADTEARVRHLDTDEVRPATMFDPALIYYADSTPVVMRAKGTERTGVTFGMAEGAAAYAFQAVRWDDGGADLVAPHVLHRVEETTPADAAPLFAALAAHEAARDALFTPTPNRIETLAHRLRALGPAAPGEHHLEIVETLADIEDAWEALRTAGDVSSRTKAFGMAQGAARRAKAVILAIAPHAEHMRGTDLPRTAEEIRAAARAYLATDGTAEELSAIETGTPSVRVNARSTLPTGSHIFVRITAGIDSPVGYIAAHPPVVVRFPRLDGRQDPIANARKVFTPKRLRVEVPVSFHGDRRI
ncbi:hypothetical protein [Streptomyces pseudoechinosporeus]